MSRLWRELGGHRGSGTRARRRRGRFRETPGGLGKLRLEPASEFRHLLLQSGDLGLQGGKLFRQGEQRSGQGQLRAENGRRWLLGGGGQAALMQASQQVEVLAAHPFFAAITGMALEGKLSIGQPTVQGCGIDAEATTSVGNRNNGPGIAPFTRKKKTRTDRSTPENSRENSQENSGQQKTMILGTDLPDGLLSSRLSQLFHGADDGNSLPNTDGRVGSGTSDRPVALR